jgi:hypothetical protein
MKNLLVLYTLKLFRLCYIRIYKVPMFMHVPYNCNDVTVVYAQANE